MLHIHMIHLANSADMGNKSCPVKDVVSETPPQLILTSGAECRIR